MKISPNLQDLLNAQIRMEFYSMNLYLSMSSYFLEQELNGFANFFRVQSLEEHLHALKQFDYLHHVGGRLNLGQIEAPVGEFANVEQIFEQTLAHEKQVTASINRFVEAALAEKDYATHTFLQWFLTEQVEEEATMLNLFRKVQRIGDSSASLYMLDEELARRKLGSAGAKTE